ncbi:ATP-dependent translocase ABCB1-like [Anneissia japonica]|uniref:ATP-dependent translocase ABCB1-like n=1 Tax=Anneissia japonica TaxID=1529436 RepID=UPI001425AAFA|nr:ATP-dependent translocase ABCB1-like [Anneissia japonica]
MLERFYDPAEGSVMVDSNNIKTLNLPFLRSQMSIVSQEPVLFNCTIRENIAYSVENIPDLDAIINVAKQANIHDFISSLPEVSTKNPRCYVQITEWLSLHGIQIMNVYE